MANHASHGALPYPVRNARFTILIPYLDADGDPTDPTTPDTEVSKDGGAFADCVEEVTTITGAGGTGFITLTGAETDCAILAVLAKVASGPKATVMTLHPRVLPPIFTGTAQAGAAGSITLATSAPAIANLLVGCIVKTTGGTGGGGAGGAGNQARVITAYTSGRVASVTPNWETTPDSTTTYEVLMTPEAAAVFANTVGWNTTAVPTENTAGYPIVTVKDGTGTGEIDTFSGKVLLQDGAVTASVIATGSIDADAVALDAAVKITGGVSGTADSGSTTAIVDSERTEADTDYWKGSLVVFTSGTLNGQTRLITAFDPATDTLTFAPATTVAVGTHTYRILPFGRADLHLWLGALVNALVSGRVDASVGAIANNAITAAAIADGAIDAATFAADTNTYQAKVWLQDDNGGTADRYVVVYFKNGQPITAGITSPTIQVIKTADGTDLVASVALTEIPTSTGLWKRDETTNRVVNGASYIAKVQAIIDGATRTWFQPIGRDS